MHLPHILSCLVAASTAFASTIPSELVKRADIKGFDISAAQPSSFWSCTYKAGYRKPVIRGYRQACGTGGSVDPNFLPSYKAARKAGYTNIDAYMFPCTGSQPTGVACKSIKKQLDEFLGYIAEHKIIVQRLWFDVEPGSGECNAWQESKANNLALAKSWVKALKGSGLKWGIYGNGNQWTAMFPSRSSNIGNDLPLWAVQFDSKPGVSSVDTFMGGWTKAYAKQYKLGTSAGKCGGSLDLDSFSH